MMRTMAGRFLTFFGIFWFGMLVLLYLLGTFGKVGGPFPIEALVTLIPGAILLVVGLALYIPGSISDRKFLEEHARRAKNLFDNGLPARGKITFVDKNYSVLLNQKPIYSIVEFTFEDHLGRPHTSRKENVDSDLVIRAQISVGSEVDVKYLKENPDENALLVRDPSAQT